MLKIAICDDSENAAENLKNVLETCELSDKPEIKIFLTGKELLSELLSTDYDIVFLDIDMPNENGIEIGKEFKEIKPDTILIFCTNYPQYAIEAFDCEAFHYVLKPCTYDKIQKILSRAIEKLNIVKKYHIIKIHKKTLKIPISEIYYIEYCQKHIIYHLSKEDIETTGRFADVCNELKKFGFYQTHQGYMVNFDKVHDFKGNSVILEDGRDVLISVRKKTDTLLAYAKYVEELT